MRILSVIKSEKIARGPFQSRSALVHTPRTQGHLPGSPSQEASGRDRSAPSGVGQIRFGVGFLQGTQWFIAGWSSPVARQAHNLKVIGSNPIPATRQQALENAPFSRAFCRSNFGPKFRSWKRRGSGGRKVVA